MFLDVARSAVRQLGEDGAGPSAYAADHLITQAKALIDALSMDTSGEDDGGRRLAADMVLAVSEAEVNKLKDTRRAYGRHAGALRLAAVVPVGR